MNWRKGFLSVIGLMSYFLAPAQSDFGSIIGVDITKKIAKGLNFNFEEEFRTRSDFSEVERYSHSFEISYKLFSSLKLGGAYNLINYNHEKRGWEIRHRYYFYATGNVSAGRFTFSLRERFQSTKRQGVAQTATRANPKNYLRSRLKVDYDIRKSKFTPYTSLELFNTLNDPQKNGMTQMRYVVGIEYKLNKKNSLELYYRYQDYIDEEEINIQYIGMCYSYKF